MTFDQKNSQEKEIDKLIAPTKTTIQSLVAFSINDIHLPEISHSSSNSNTNS